MTLADEMIPTEPLMAEAESTSSTSVAEKGMAGTAAGDALPAAVTSGKRVPDFFIVGHAKCGTTALYHMLESHPQIYVSVKEPRFFAQELRTRYWRPASSRRQRPTTLDGYVSLFAGASPEQRIGEASTLYLRSSTAASRIAEVQPAARIIIILREPVRYLRSFHLQAVRNYDETQKDFRRAIELEEARRQGKRISRFSQTPNSLFYSDHVRYVEQLRRYHAVFPPENVLVLIYEDFRADNEGTVRKVLRFLDVDDTAPISTVQLESSHTVRYLLLDQIARGISIARHSRAAAPISRTMNALTPRHLRDSEAFGAIWRRILYTDRPPPDEEFVLELRRRFKGEVEALSDYLGRDLVTQWGYDKID